jgi:SAM-dependent methyltransferase
VRRFDADYLEHTREGMWSDSRAALSALDLPACERVLDVGCGTGELTRVLAEETDGAVVGVDADTALLAHAAEHAPVVAGDATRLPFRDDAVDLVVCQALLINLPDPLAAVREFARVASDRVAVVEPDNAAVTVDSTVGAEASLARRAREAYLDGVATDVSLGEAADLFAEAGLSAVQTSRYDHVRTVEPPYDDAALRDAKRKATGAGLADDRETMLAGALTAAEYDAMRREWRAMGRDVVRAMQAGEYRREETVPFYVTVGDV